MYNKVDEKEEFLGYKIDQIRTSDNVSFKLISIRDKAKMQYFLVFSPKYSNSLILTLLNVLHSHLNIFFLGSVWNHK